MNIQLLSDLHLEVHPQFEPEPAPQADVLVLAGDVGSYQTGSLLQGEHFGLERFSPLPQYAAWPTPVIFVPGNHEYDAQDFHAAQDRLRASCERLGLIWLERETAVLGSVRFVGTTLWSDFDALADDAGVGKDQRLAMREKAFRAANYYLRTTGSTLDGMPLLAPEVRSLALQCRAWLAQALSLPFDGPTVAITHFAPSLRSADPRYGLTPGTAGFCNALDALLPSACLWLHGHLHTPIDYTARGVRADSSSWSCRVRANPLGYARKDEQSFFDPLCCVALEKSAP
ncbi:MAG: metallophosphoesterase [Burkholderiaceae bacterium]|jgi:hypothetical protein|nr:metallophosphoesterase [Burkholderiaceae bacterium]MCO5104040.1 metallophosphoesterase [Burkholderiaceae bacterium]